jgi:K+-sensing histidine kinase KdpD
MPAQPVAQHELTVLATVAHELRGPLTALATSSELLAEDFVHLETNQIRDMLGAMHRRALWLQGLVENLLCAATIREGRLPPRLAVARTASVWACRSSSPSSKHTAALLASRIAAAVGRASGFPCRRSAVLAHLNRT